MNQFDLLTKKALQVTVRPNTNYHLPKKTFASHGTVTGPKNHFNNSKQEKKQVIISQSTIQEIVRINFTKHGTVTVPKNHFVNFKQERNRSSFVRALFGKEFVLTSQNTAR